MIRPGKRVVFYAAVGHGAEAKDFYEHPDAHGLLGETAQEMYSKVAAKFGWADGKTLYEYICSQDGDTTPWDDLANMTSDALPRKDS